MRITNIFGKLFLKSFSLAALILLTILNSILKVAIWIFNIISVPVATIAVIAAGYMGFKNGFSIKETHIFIAAAILVGLKYLLPLIPERFDSLKFSLKEYLYEPLIIRSPVKYTI